MAKFPADLVAQPGAQAARLVALSVLDATRAARARVGTDDTEALHDFRVGLRRLRSVLRAFRPLFGDALSGKLRRRLRELAAATGEARDAEVQLLWIDLMRRKLPAGQRAGVAWLIARLKERRDRGYDAIREDVAPGFDKLERRLRRALGATARHDGETPFAIAVGERLATEAAELAQRLALVHTAADEAEAHGARIEIKRIRYLLEPLGSEVSAVAAALKRLKKAQDALGELHDLHTTAARLGDATAAAAAERARWLHQQVVDDAAARPRGPRPGTAGLLALARTARQEQDRLVDAVLSDRTTQALPGDLAALANELRTPIPALAPPSGAQAPEHPKNGGRAAKRQRRGEPRPAAPVAEEDDVPLT
jgi:CHAD domain-containing protein